MKALCFQEHGELDVIRYGDVPDPAPGPGEVLLRVRACAINTSMTAVARGGRIVIIGNTSGPLVEIDIVISSANRSASSEVPWDHTRISGKW